MHLVAYLAFYLPLWPVLISFGLLSSSIPILRVLRSNPIIFAFCELSSINLDKYYIYIYINNIELAKREYSS